MSDSKNSDPYYSYNIIFSFSDGEGKEEDEEGEENDLEVCEESDVTDSENENCSKSVQQPTDQTGLPNDPFVAR